MYNNVLLVGRAVDKPTIRTIESGASVGNLTIAVNRPFKSLEGKQEVDFINCVMWGPIATNSADYINKGSLICVRGFLKTKEETVVFNKEEDLKKNIKSYEVYVEKINFIKL